MKCQKAKKLLHIFLDGFLEEKTAIQVKKHIEKCENCKKEFEYLKLTIDLVKNYPVQKPSPYFSFLIKRKVHQYAKNISEPFFIFKNKFEWISAISIFLGLTLGIILFFKGRIINEYSQKLYISPTKFFHPFLSFINGITVKSIATLEHLSQFLIEIFNFLSKGLLSQEFKTLLYITLPLMVFLNLWLYFTSPKLNQWRKK